MLASRPFPFCRNTERRLGLPVLIIVSALLFGCVQEETTGHTAPSPRLTELQAPNTLCSEIAKVMCYNVFECCTGWQIEQLLGVKQSTTEEECRADLELVCKNNEQMALVLRALKNPPTISLDIRGVVECLKALLVTKEQCFPLVFGETAYEKACVKDLITGRQAAGKDCLADFECQGEAYCGSDRKCKLLARRGESCDASSDCAEGLFCGPDETGSLFCRDLADQGEKCSNSYEPAETPPVLPISCGTDLYCAIAEDELTGNCQEKKAVGETCSDKQPCRSKLICLPGQCADDRVCESDSDCSGECSESGDTCTKDADCGGRCSNSFSSCSVNSDCGGICKLKQSLVCTDEWDCHSGNCEISGYLCYGEFACGTTGMGTCSGSGNPCQGDEYCGAGEKCVPQETCIPSDSDSCEFGTCQHETCQGTSTCQNRRCAENWATLDYCKAGFNAIDYVTGNTEKDGGTT